MGQESVRDPDPCISVHAIAKFDVDGFRIDTLEAVERDFARTFGNAMRDTLSASGKELLHLR